jgi:hypothetical protein
MAAVGGEVVILCAAHNLPVRHDKACFREYRKKFTRKHNLVAPSQGQNVWVELAVKKWRVEESDDCGFSANHE